MHVSVGGVMGVQQPQSVKLTKVVTVWLVCVVDESCQSMTSGHLILRFMLESRLNDQNVVLARNQVFGQRHGTNSSVHCSY